MLVVIQSNVFIVREAAAQSITYHDILEINTVLMPMSRYCLLVVLHHLVLIGVYDCHVPCSWFTTHLRYMTRFLTGKTP